MGCSTDSSCFSFSDHAPNTAPLMRCTPKLCKAAVSFKFSGDARIVGFFSRMALIVRSALSLTGPARTTFCISCCTSSIDGSMPAIPAIYRMSGGNACLSGTLGH